MLKEPQASWLKAGRSTIHSTAITTAMPIKNMITKKLERKTHVDINHDGVIGGPRLKDRMNPVKRVVGKIERKTHVDLNHNGVIGW
jgi:hypothetical protein